ncbi:glycosyltransferase family 39 protein [Halobaculum magnesiiphilum]|uniref:Glycosyltransferase family 39 protein n=1 Tax=Halobaculum magnesiiphilum TaxID=1017351 RepID=A0A8T8WB75_9EURY|nr:glycosyltransferase family 39 protein [Halobaculum magnesiiphilum]QZP37088.1 glycosyltransferase family 39 protein [Halobaculum magnesiiphilum]
MSVVKYVADFEGYYPLRMPFFDVLSAAAYPVFQPFIGIKAIAVFNVLISCVSLIIFVRVCQRIFSSQISIIGAVAFYAFYPKIIVMSGRGLAEVASVAFVVIGVWLFLRAEASGQLISYLLSGIAFTLAYLMFIPAVVVGILFSIFAAWRVFIYKRYFKKGMIQVTTFIIPPFLTGISYLVFGPIREVIGLFSSEQGSYFAYPLFINNYGPIERLARYTAYSYFDFWWHLRGFDTEQNILSTIDMLLSFTGPLGPIYLVGYFGITIILSALIILGIRNLKGSSSINGLRGLVLLWLGTYFILYNLKNLGWIGVFQTRQIFPIFPAICIVFGSGLAAITGSRIGEGASKILSSIDTRQAVTVCVLVLFIPLLINAGIHGVFLTDNFKEGKVQPANALIDSTDPNNDIVVLRWKNYNELFLYSAGEVRSEILVPTESEKKRVAYFTGEASVRVVSPAAISNGSVDYLYVARSCGAFSGLTNEYINAAKSSGRVIYNSTGSQSNKCDTSAMIVEL